MRPQEFVTAYPREVSGQARYPERLRDALIESRQWSTTWGELLHDAFVHLKVPPHREFLALSHLYCSWAKQQFPYMLQTLMKWYEETEDDTTYVRLLMEQNFHTMNLCVQDAWNVLLYQPHYAGQRPHLVDVACCNLANAALGLYASRDDLDRNNLFFGPDAERARAWYTGVLTEIDTYIALLRMVSRRGGMIIVPAPFQFEKLAGPANADFIVFDKATGQVRGVQVKSEVREADTERYDRSRITLIDGVHDLESQLARRTNRFKSDKHQVAWPGMISAHFLGELKPTPYFHRVFPRPTLADLKRRARDLVHEIPSKNHLAYAHVAERVAHDMDLDLKPPKPEPKRKPPRPRKLQ